MKSFLKWAAGALGVVVGILVLVVGVQTFAFGRATKAVRDAPLTPITLSSDSVVLARGEHLANALGGCTGCHAENLGGQVVEDLGPVGVIRAPNLTTGAGGVGSAYTDAELARAVKYGVRRDGRSIVYMPTREHYWWPDADIRAVVSWVRAQPPVDNTVEPSTVGLMGKLLSQFGVFEVHSAEMIDPSVPEIAPEPEPTAVYGSFLARGCQGCHSETFAGGPLPGAPAELAVPANLTPHESGIGPWSQDDFFTTLRTGVRPDGRALDPFMPIGATQRMTDLELTAIWEYLRTIEALPLGGG